MGRMKDSTNCGTIFGHAQKEHVVAKPVLDKSGEPLPERIDTHLEFYDSRKSVDIVEVSRSPNQVAFVRQKGILWK